MVTSTKFRNQSQRRSYTLDFVDSGAKFIIEERNKHDATRHIADAALCIVAGVVTLGCYMLFFLPQIALFNDNFGISLSVVMVGISLSLYAFATRGSRSQVGFDKLKKKFWICKLNAQGHARIVTHFSRTDVQSFFIRRPDAPHKDAALCARIQGKFGPVTLLRGRLDEIGEAHSELCEQMRDDRIAVAVKPVRKVNSGSAGLMANFRAGSV